MRATRSLVLIFGLIQLAHAVSVYLHPAPTVVPAHLSAARANLAIARHLNLERFERLGDDQESWDDALLANNEGFVGTGTRDGLLITINEEDAKGVFYRHKRPSLAVLSDA
jgi:hypothetical protein